MIDKVLILLPTYNSEEFLRLQVYSILAQKNVDLTLCIMDDFSGDNTKKIIKEFKERVNIIEIEAPFKFGKAASSFLYMMSLLPELKIDYHFVALADHDDIWNENKICAAIETIKHNFSDGYSSSVQSIKVNEFGYGSSIYVNKSKAQKQYDYFFESPGPGCTFVLTKSLAQIINSYIISFPLLKENVWGHDWLIYAIARANGMNWFIDSRSHILYLQRSVNETGVNLGYKAAFRRFKALKNGWFLAQAFMIAEVVAPNSVIANKLGRLNLLDKIWFLLNFRRLRRGFFDSLILIFSIIFYGKANINDFKSGGRL